jgi:hypothetical protein
VSHQDQELEIIQKYMRGYQVYMQFKKKLISFKQLNIVRMNSESTITENTFARATNQKDIISGMRGIQSDKEINKLKERDRNLKHPVEEEKAEASHESAHTDSTLERQRESKKLIPNPKHVQNKHSKSTTSFENVQEKDKSEKSFLKEMSKKSLKLLNKKRPNSAKSKNCNEDVTSEKEENKEKFMQIMEKLRNFKPQRTTAKNSETGNNVHQNTDKPPLNDSSRRNENLIKGQKTSGSATMSERFSQVSPSASSIVGFSTKKYQEILKKHIYDDYQKE